MFISRRRKRSLFIAACLVTVVVLAEAASGESVSFPNTTCSWSIVSSPNTMMPVNVLRAVSAVNATDVWAVGDATPNGESTGQTLIEHWNGTTWTIVRTPPLSGAAALNGVAENSSTDVWAVGEVGDQTLTEHWNGRRWRVVPSPSISTVHGQPASDFLTGVVALAPDDVWAVGYAATFTDLSETLTLHWDGRNWSIVPSPSPGEGFGIRFAGVTAVSTNDIWAAGQDDPNGLNLNMIQHWDGASWSVIPSAHYEDGDTALATSAISATDIWTVGAYFISNAEGSPTQTATWHWDGTSWSIVPSPSPSPYFTLFYGVVGISSNDVWAVGTYQANVAGVVLTPMIQHWDGAGWSVFPSPRVRYAELLGVAAVSPTELWSVGFQAGRTLIEHYTCQ
jgi:hypothetical protein